MTVIIFCITVLCYHFYVLMFSVWFSICDILCHNFYYNVSRVFYIIIFVVISSIIFGLILWVYIHSIIFVLRRINGNKWSKYFYVSTVTKVSFTFVAIKTFNQGGDLLDQQRNVVIVFLACCILIIRSYSPRTDAVYCKQRWGIDRSAKICRILGLKCIFCQFEARVPEFDALFSV
jgi:hypothetical protein